MIDAASRNNRTVFCHNEIFKVLERIHRGGAISYIATVAGPSVEQPVVEVADFVVVGIMHAALVRCAAIVHSICALQS
ncbi:hypothetical protein N005_24340 [Pseudomonas mediterranea CFBP 5447]|nr:hypothetical protein N005_24340 [Pseudomonas mediterranea CFBP 5447]